MAEDAAKHQFPVVNSGDPERAASETIEWLWGGCLSISNDSHSISAYGPPYLAGPLDCAYFLRFRG